MASTGNIKNRYRTVTIDVYCTCIDTVQQCVTCKMPLYVCIPVTEEYSGKIG